MEIHVDILIDGVGGVADPPHKAVALGQVHKEDGDEGQIEQEVEEVPPAEGVQFHL